MKVLVCGGRDFTDSALVSRYLNAIFENSDLNEPLLLIHGDCATGADWLADEWAQKCGSVQVVRCPANWKLGKKAGPLRNEAMLELKPDVVIAFPGGKGTADMVRRAKQKHVRVIEAQNGTH